MAEAIFNRVSRDEGLRLRALSAGTRPGLRVHPQVAQALQELGLDVSENEPTALTDDMVEKAVRVITMGCQIDSDSCPAIRTRGTEDWGLSDPKEAPLSQVRELRDHIRVRVKALVTDLTPKSFTPRARASRP